MRLAGGRRVRLHIELRRERITVLDRIGPDLC